MPPRADAPGHGSRAVSQRMDGLATKKRRISTLHRRFGVAAWSVCSFLSPLPDARRFRWSVKGHGHETMGLQNVRRRRLLSTRRFHDLHNQAGEDD